MEWEEIKKEHLEKLYYEDELTDSQIAERFHVSKGKVSYKRKKYSINLYQKIVKDFKADNKEIYKKLNDDSKSRLCRKENIDRLSIALTHYVFRNGPVEDMHTDGKLTQSDMKTLNKYMTNRIASILYAIEEGDWLKIELLFAYYQMYGMEWDKVEPDMGELDFALNDYKSTVKMTLT